ncbi:uncharacterized protein BJ171DRAFT_489187 [Polychytrium aggregatum]|uniref:uncharacterized protein n=1 Tax=Polychytrium aggregatum TaxID=110093 RepID=UPI0022FDC367|nr:uncharacterized protein BJ171DRAFT_489187 [Polychytrium aggregatum]KAI9208526.1 hypothetical protein BJ171DRAFT_489187 [Polychytrium aggregatum]
MHQPVEHPRIPVDTVCLSAVDTPHPRSIALASDRPRRSSSPAGLALFGSILDRCPPEILAHVCEFLVQRDMYALALVSRRLHQLTTPCLMARPRLRSIEQLVKFAATLECIQHLSTPAGSTDTRGRYAHWAEHTRLTHYILASLYSLDLSALVGAKSKLTPQLVCGLIASTLIHTSSPRPASALKSLNLADAYLLDSQTLASIIDMCPSLVHLNLMGCRVDIVNDAFLQTISEKCPNLRSLLMDGWATSGRGVAHLMINSLYLSELQVSPRLQNWDEARALFSSTLDPTTRSAALESLTIRKIPIAVRSRRSDQPVAMALAALLEFFGRNLRQLSLEHHHDLPDQESWQALLAMVPRLHTLSFRHSKISEGYLALLIRLLRDSADSTSHGRSPQSIRLGSCGLEDMHALGLPSAQLEFVQELDLSGNPRLSNRATIVILQHFPCLRSLNLNGVTLLPYAAAQLVECCPLLESLVAGSKRQSLRDLSVWVHTHRPRHLGELWLSISYQDWDEVLDETLDQAASADGPLRREDLDLITDLATAVESLKAVHLKISALEACAETEAVFPASLRTDRLRSQTLVLPPSAGSRKVALDIEYQEL